MTDDTFYIIDNDRLRVLQCDPVEAEDVDYTVVLFVFDEDDEQVYSSHWKSIDKNAVDAFLDSGWDLSKQNPLT